MISFHCIVASYQFQCNAWKRKRMGAHAHTYTVSFQFNLIICIFLFTVFSRFEISCMQFNVFFFVSPEFSLTMRVCFLVIHFLMLFFLSSPLFNSVVCLFGSSSWKHTIFLSFYFYICSVPFFYVCCTSKKNCVFYIFSFILYLFFCVRFALCFLIYSKRII